MCELEMRKGKERDGKKYVDLEKYIDLYSFIQHHLFLFVLVIIVRGTCCERVSFFSFNIFCLVLSVSPLPQEEMMKRVKKRRPRNEKCGEMQR